MRSKPNTAKVTLGDCLSVFSRKDQNRILAVILLQIILGALDLLGVLIIGVIGALTVTGIQSNPPGNRASQVLKLFGIENLTFQEQTSLLALAATLVLIGRTIVTVIFTRRILFFIARRSAVISGNLISRLLQQNNTQANSRTIQETIYAVTTGVNAVTLGVVGTTVTIIADASLLLVMTTGLFLVDPLVATSTLFLFATVGLILYRAMHNRAIRLGQRDSELNIHTNERLSEVLSSYREATVRSRRSYYANEIARIRFRLSDVLAEQSFMPLISKYVIEATIILGAVLVAALQFLMQDSGRAIATLAVFLAAGTRIAPAILRVQQGSVSIKSNLGTAKQTLKLISELPDLKVDSTIPEYNDEFTNLKEDIQISHLSFKYPDGSHNALSDVNIEIPAGSNCAIVGPSGAGKTTLVDLILGLVQPTHGIVVIAGMTPMDLIQKYPGAIGYVPQDVSIFNGTIRENVALGFPRDSATDARVQRALDFAELTAFVSSLPYGLDTEVGPRGSKLSGGQKQRLGIARAMFTSPKLLILDESTSALDAETELKVSNSIARIPYKLTVITIAHRLSTVKDADQVVYVDKGKVRAVGTFTQIRDLVPEFDVQANLMGIKK